MNNRIKGFEWYLPLAFKDSVAQCKFEQGDVIYPCKPQGKNWGEEIMHIDFFIQVQSPTRTITSTTGDLDVFSSNWNTKIIFEKIYPNNLIANKIIETTQGALFSFLWKNDENLLYDKNLKPVLYSIRPKHINSDFIKSKIPSDSTGFAIVVDSVSNLINSKRNAIKNILMENFVCDFQLFTSYEAISKGTLEENPNSEFSPTLGVELFIIYSQDTIKITEEIKKVLFKGKKDQFSIQTHGLLIKN